MINFLLFTCGASFFTGAFLCNSLPHLLCGLQGTPFPSPFAKPPGKGDSSPLANFFWGSFNLLAGVGLLAWQPVTVSWNGGFAAFAAGFLVLGAMMSRHFGKVRQGCSGK
jgi:hypothetical protein